MVRPIRRIVAGNDDRGIAVALSDGPSPDVRLDPARPGFAMTRLWVQETTPARAKGIRETLHLPHTLEPPPGGSLCRAVEFPPEAPYIGKVGEAEVRAWFAAMGSPGARVAGGPHPYMQRTPSLDFCSVFEGEITLVLDTAEVHLRAGDQVILRGVSHAWSNRSDRPAIVIMSQHAAVAKRRSVPPVQRAAEPTTAERAADCAAWSPATTRRGAPACSTTARCQIIFRARPGPVSTNCGRSIRSRPGLPATSTPAPPDAPSCIRRRPRARIGASPIRRRSGSRSHRRRSRLNSTPRTRPAAPSGSKARVTRACTARRRSTSGVPRRRAASGAGGLATCCSAPATW